jgi:DNA polymerase-3 subunit epsilon
MNEEAEIIYIGKSVNIRQRVLSHFYNNRSKRAIEMKALVSDVEHELTGSELVASLLESSEIKKHKPLYNRRQRRTKQHWGLFTCYEDGYLCFRVEKTSLQDSAPVKCFDSKKEGINFLYKLIEQHELCQKLCGLYPTDHACFHYQVGTCHGACVHEEAPEPYNARAKNAIEPLELRQKNIFVIDKGRHPEEKSVVQVQGGKYIGFGYCTSDTNSLEILSDCISPREDNHEVKMIIKQYLEQQKAEQVIIPEGNPMPMKNGQWQ